MLEDIASSRFGFWIVAATIVAVDQAFLLTPGTFAFSVSSADRTRLRVSRIALHVARQGACFLAPRLSVPAVLRLRRKFAEEDTATRAAVAGANAQAVGAERAAHNPVDAGCIDPDRRSVISASRGIALSIIVLLPLLYLLSIAGAVVLWRMRKRFGLSNGTTIKLAAELVLCPVLIVNVSKRLSLSQAARLAPSDVAAFSVTRSKRWPRSIAICDFIAASSRSEQVTFRLRPSW